MDGRGEPRPVEDERVALRARLDEGDWRALLDPLLPLVLLDDPGDWWTQACGECGLRLLAVLAGMLPGADRLSALEAWRRELSPAVRPPRGWDQVRRELTQREGWALTLALDLLLVEPGVSMSVLGAQRRLAHHLLTRRPDASPLATDHVTAALTVLDQWAPA